MAQCLIGLGSNLNDRDAALRAAWQAIGRFPATQALRLSHLHTCRPAGGPPGQDDFMNAVGLVETALAPQAILGELLALEVALGRVRHERWGARVIDLDLLLHERTVLQTQSLTLPHPRMAFRRFVLEPAAEIAPDLVYPVNGWSIARLLQHLNSTEPLIAMAALDPPTLSDALQKIASRSAAIVARSVDGKVHLPADRWTILDRWPAEGKAADEPRPTAPKLVVLADSPGDSSAEAQDRRRRWRQLMHRPDTGPVLWIAGEDSSLIADEVVAAMEAMR